MKESDLEKGKELQYHIRLLETKIKTFNKLHNYAHLQIYDHYGNKGDKIETYALGADYEQALGPNFIADYYGEFLEKVRVKMQERIDELKLQLLKL